MSVINKYFEIGEVENCQPKVCYLCDEELDDKVSPDHIIPDHLFSTGDSHRPKLIVHSTCNNKKSIEDQWFVKMLYLRCSINPKAENMISSFMAKAINEKTEEAYLVGGNPRNYVLAKTIFKKSKWGLHLIQNSEHKVKLQLSDEETNRFTDYLITMCKGLFLKRVSNAFPLDNVELMPVQYSVLDLFKGREIFLKSILYFLKSSEEGFFGQRWKNGNIIYFGSRVVESPHKGYVFVEFYKELGILATFD